MYVSLTKKSEIRLTLRILALMLQSPRVGIPEGREQVQQNRGLSLALFWTFHLAPGASEWNCLVDRQKNGVGVQRNVAYS